MRQMLLTFAIAVAAWGMVQVSSVLAQVEETELEAEPEELELAEERELETDRDAFTPATSTIGRRVTVVESSYSFIDNRRVAETHSLPELLLRRGLTERIELRLGWNFEVGGSVDVVSGNAGGEGEEGGKVERESQILYGIKALITEQQGLLPRSAVIMHGYTPTSGESPATDFLITYAFGWELPNDWRLDSSLHAGTEHAEHDAFNLWAPSVVLRIPINERWHAHVEYFGIYSQGAEHGFRRSFFSPGAHCLITSNLELGVRLGWGLTDDAPNFFSNVGVGLRF